MMPRIAMKHADRQRIEAEHVRRLDDARRDALSRSPARMGLAMYERHPVAYGAAHPAVPKTVYVAHVAPLTIPEPPLLDENATLDRRVLLIARAFEGAYRDRYAKPCWVFRSQRCAPMASKFGPMLVEADKLFREHAIAPAAWCAFTLTMWHENMQNPLAKPAPLNFVFGAKQIAERRGWFRSEALFAARMVYSDTARAFMTKQRAMNNALSFLPATATDDDIAAKVAEYFAPGAFDREVEELKAEAVRLNTEIRVLLNDGQWVWNPRARATAQGWVL